MREGKYHKYSINIKEERSSRVSCFVRMYFLPGLFAKAVLVRNTCWLSTKGRKAAEEAAECSPSPCRLAQMLPNMTSCISIHILCT